MSVTLRAISAYFIALAAISWAASSFGAAHLNPLAAGLVEDTALYEPLPSPVRLRDDRNRGLTTSTWLNGRGPYVFVVDTGAGVTIISERIASEAGVQVKTGRTTAIAGLSGKRVVAVREAVVGRIALGTPQNVLPSSSHVLIAPVPQGIDGILDPTEAFAPLGYSIDLPRLYLSAFDPRAEGLKIRNQPPGGATVRWLRDRESRRPFVRLGDGRLALLDTGSALGLGLNEEHSLNHRPRGDSIRDIAGGTIQANRVGPSTVTIDSLVLRGVPTDIIRGAEAGAPVILGRDALFPFRITFDPLHRLIEIAPPPDNR